MMYKEIQSVAATCALVCVSTVQTGQYSHISCSHLPAFASGEVACVMWLLNAFSMSLKELANSLVSSLHKSRSCMNTRKVIPNSRMEYMSCKIVDIPGGSYNLVCAHHHATFGINASVSRCVHSMVGSHECPRTFTDEIQGNMRDVNYLHVYPNGTSHVTAPCRTVRELHELSMLNQSSA